MSINYNAGYDHWVRSTRFKLDGKSEMLQGCEISVRGERGRFRFHEHVKTAEGLTWVTVYGPVNAVGSRSSWRSFDPGRVKTVHRIKRGRG